jgi:hypothetical protein
MGSRRSYFENTVALFPAEKREFRWASSPHSVHAFETNFTVSTLYRSYSLKIWTISEQKNSASFPHSAAAVRKSWANRKTDGQSLSLLPATSWCVFVPSIPFHSSRWCTVHRGSNPADTLQSRGVWAEQPAARDLTFICVPPSHTHTFTRQV